MGYGEGGREGGRGEGGGRVMGRGDGCRGRTTENYCKKLQMEVFSFVFCLLPLADASWRLGRGLGGMAEEYFLWRSWDDLGVRFVDIPAGVIIPPDVS